MNTCTDRLRLTNMNMSMSMLMLTSMAPKPSAMTMSTLVTTVNTGIRTNIRLLHLPLGFAMRHMAAFLVFLLFILTFNAYACLLPIQPESAIDCSSSTTHPVRRTCDVFLQLRRPSPDSFTQELPILNVDLEAALRVHNSVFLVFRSQHPPLGADTPVHHSIPTTVLRI